MDERLSAILGLAFRTVPAREANQALAQARREAAVGGARLAHPVRGDEDAAPMAHSYELVLPAEATWDWFAKEALPKLVYHLESICARPPACGGVVAALFDGDQLHFLRAADLIAHAAASLGFSTEELFSRHGTGERRTAVREPPLLRSGD